MKVLAANRWFALADLLCATLSGAIWYGVSQGQVSSQAQVLASRPILPAWPLLIALLPLVFRAAAGRFPVHRTPFDLLLGIFLLTALLGAWISYDPVSGWAKFWVILGAVFFFYALSGQPEENLWLTAGLLSAVGAIAAGAFLLGQAIQKDPATADLSFLRWVTLGWLSVRPATLAWNFGPNLAGGLLAALAPFPAALAIFAWREWRLGTGLYAFFTLVIIGFGLALTSSRGAWIALFAAISAGSLWLLSRSAGRILGKSPGVVFTAAALLVAMLLAGFVWLQPGGLVGLANRLPGLPTGGNRLELARNSLHILADFPFTGGGLAAFAGLYSQYIMIIPFFLYRYSHNFLLDVAIEQGLFGALALAAIFLGSAILLVYRPVKAANDRLNLLRAAVLGGLIVIAVHGIVDDALYGESGTPLLFFLPGMSVALCKAGMRVKLSPQLTGPDGRIIQATSPHNPVAAKTAALIPWIVALTVLAGGLAIDRKNILARWYANRGAVLMAQAELADFPRNEWDAERLRQIYSTETIRSASVLFERALQLDQENATASYRMGLIAEGLGDFNRANSYLEQAHQADPRHRGITKALGYTCVWTGDLDQGLALLDGIAEAQPELEIYAWWWLDYGQAEFADRSAQAAALLK